MSKSVFTLTFIVEIVDVEVWHDCEEGWLDLGPSIQGMKIQYTLSPGFNFDVDILIWPHVAKIWCGSQFGWVRTWQYLQRRWLSFTIRHAVPVKVLDFINYKVTVYPSIGLGSLGATAKNDKNFEVYIPELQFGERRYFATVIDGEVPFMKFIYDLIWEPLLQYIPATCMDGIFDVPTPVTDVRHQDTVIYAVQETILDRKIPELQEDDLFEVVEKKEVVVSKKKDKGKSTVTNAKQKFEISLTGNAILAGAGRIIPFQTIGEPNPMMGEVIALISSSNLPAYDDVPILFINIQNLDNIPIQEFKKIRLVELYTRWTLGEQVIESEHKRWRGSSKVNFDDHSTLPLPVDFAAELTATFLDDPFKIDIRAVLQPKSEETQPKLFGFDKLDRNYSYAVAPYVDQDLVDVSLANTKIDCRQLAKGINGFISGEYFLYPPKTCVKSLGRDTMCTNDFNGIRQPLEPRIVISPSVIMESNMNVEVSIGIVGCKPKKLTESFSRLGALIYDSELLMRLLKTISKINDEIFPLGDKNLMLSGFALDVGDTVFLFIEGPKDGKILIIWEMTEEPSRKIKTVFSSSARYSTRLYPEFMVSMPFNILKMYAPIGVLLACPPVYARPTLPLPARAALLKLSQVIAKKLPVVPTRSEMPTARELKSFRLELCAPPKPSKYFSQPFDYMARGQDHKLN